MAKNETTISKFSAALAGIQAKGYADNGNRIFRMAGTTKTHFWNATKGRRATLREAREAGLA